MDWGFSDVCIIGLGLMGGSFAMSLRDAGFTGKIRAIDVSVKSIETGLELQIIDQGSKRYSLVAGSDLVVIAVPVGAYEKVVKGIQPYLLHNPIVMDIGSVKGKLVYMCERLLGDSAYFVGTHPIAGTEKSGVSNAISDLFIGAKLIVTPTKNTSSLAVQKVSNLWEKLGAKIVKLDPYLHDEVFASVSHLPHIVAYSVVDAVSHLSNNLNVNLFQFTGGGFRDFTRIAMSDPVMWRDICLENRENILSAIRAFKGSIERIESLIEAGDKEGIEEFFKLARDKRKNVI